MRSLMSVRGKEQIRFRPLLPKLQLPTTTVVSEEPANVSSNERAQISAVDGKTLPQSNLNSYNA